jgi:DNA excision repair protein ERCC-2
VLPEEVFPYPSFREGQKELAYAVNAACKSGGRLVAEAMSGFGKTAAVLAGSMAAAEDERLTILYVCRTKRQVLRVMEELRRFAGRHPLRATSLFSKYDYCLRRQTGFRVEPETFKWYCSFQTSNNLCSYFLNVGFNLKGVEKLVDAHVQGPGTIADLLKAGTALHVCPYEVARVALGRSDVIVTTYHYMFDANSRNILLPKETPGSKVVAIIDEAHNIRDYISGSSAVTLDLDDLRACIKASKDLYLPGVSSAISEICDRALRFCSNDSNWLLVKEAFAGYLSSGHPKDWLANLAFELSTNTMVAWYSVSASKNFPASIARVGGFLSALLSSLQSDDIALTRSEGSLTLNDTCPSKHFVSTVSRFRSTVLLSATINPTDLFLRSIGLDPAATAVYSATKGYKFRVRTLVDTGVSTRFKMRTADMYARIARRLESACLSVPGGIGIFFPSYATLDQILGLLRIQDRTMLVEKTGMSNDESDEMIATFKSKRRCVLLAVQGGRFAEGEDFPGDEMDASIVVGLPLPPPSPSMYAAYRQMESERFEGHEPYMVLSLLPALRKAFQCAGRHIRNPGKVGLVIFMDARFAQENVLRLMPSWLREDLVQGDFGPDPLSVAARSFFAVARA